MYTSSPIGNPPGVGSIPLATTEADGLMASTDKSQIVFNTEHINALIHGLYAKVRFFHYAAPNFQLLNSAPATNQTIVTSWGNDQTGVWQSGPTFIGETALGVDKMSEHAIFDLEMYISRSDAARAADVRFVLGTHDGTTFTPRITGTHQALLPVTTVGLYLSSLVVLTEITGINPAHFLAVKVEYRPLTNHVQSATIYTGPAYVSILEYPVGSLNGIGTIASQDANNVTITGGAISNTDIIPKAKILIKATSGSLSAAELKGLWVMMRNTGQTLDCLMELPLAEEGIDFEFVASTTVAKYYRFKPLTGSGQVIYFDGQLLTAEFYVGVASIVIGNSCRVTAILTATGVYNWRITSGSGSWFQQT